ncbi:dicarboxylate/amino acid:cation symporter [Actinoplanes utahensis]|uniref:Sodium:proton antiporter n=1 Tax=Actinoplanes utahensis TaxID=1869 RepID=A0A0A6UEM1_ACTUT|nr:sodium:proton antiporter [Actinoplanes utahensis]GIF31461.1 sodium:proton antiporter [Actinoplanes utahensis]
MPQRLQRIPFAAQVLAGLILGIVLGLVAREIGPVGDGSPNWLTSTLDTVGSSFVALLRALVVPLVVLAIIASIANLRGVAGAARLAGRTLFWFAITALIAVVIGIALGLIFQPGENTTVSRDAAAAPTKVGDWWAFLTGLIPSNFLGLQASTSIKETGATTSLSFNVLQLVVIAIAVGIAALKIGEKAEPFLNFNRSALDIVLRVLGWVIRLAPIGTIGLIGYAVADYGWDAIGSLGAYTGAVYLGLALVVGVVYPVLLRVHGIPVLRWFATVWPALQLAFVSRSSLGTLPVTEQVTERVGVPRSYASFAVPLGATTKMDGCAAIYPALSAIFVAQFYDIPLTVSDHLLIVLVSVLGSAATAGTTGATVMLTLTLSTLGLPLEGVGLLLAVDPILDMGRTATNVAGQVLVPTIVAKREGILGQAAERTEEPVEPVVEKEKETTTA